MLSEAQVDSVVSLVAEGSGVEAALAKLGIESNQGTHALKIHRDAVTRLKDAKAVGRVALRVAVEKQQALAQVAMDSNGRQGQ